MSAKPPANIFPKPIDKGVDPEDIAGWSITEKFIKGIRALMLQPSKSFRQINCMESI